MRMELIEINQRELKDRGVWMSGRDAWGVVVSAKLDIAPPPEPPETDPATFGYEPPTYKP